MFYIEQLVRHAQPELKERRPKKRLLLNLQPLLNVLTDLEVDLRANPNESWVKDFIGTPNHGHVALIDLIRDLADTPQTLPRKRSSKYNVLERHPVRVCLLFLLSLFLSPPPPPFLLIFLHLLSLNPSPPLPPPPPPSLSDDISVPYSSFPFLGLSLYCFALPQGTHRTQSERSVVPPIKPLTTFSPSPLDLFFCRKPLVLC